MGTIATEVLTGAVFGQTDDERIERNDVCHCEEGDEATTDFTAYC